MHWENLAGHVKIDCKNQIWLVLYFLVENMNVRGNIQN